MQDELALSSRVSAIVIIFHRNIVSSVSAHRSSAIHSESRLRFQGATPEISEPQSRSTLADIKPDQNCSTQEQPSKIPETCSCVSVSWTVGGGGVFEITLSIRRSWSGYLDSVPEVLRRGDLRRGNLMDQRSRDSSSAFGKIKHKTHVRGGTCCEPVVGERSFAEPAY